MGFTARSLSNLKDQIDIVEVVSRVVPLKKAGSNHKGVCPFHNEKTPSFVVSEQKQIFTCFGCGASGDAIEFVKRYYNLDFNEAVEKLAGEYGIELEKSNSYGEDLDIYYRINKDAAGFFYRAFTERANKGYSYMKRRGIKPAVLKKFGIGYADESWDSLYSFLTKKGYDKALLIELGLISSGKDGRCYDKFRNRVIFPIINTSGKVIGFGGRAIDPNDNPKYLNSSESKVFRKKNNLYGLNLSRAHVSREGFIILVEGYMDTIGLYQGGVENVSASLGTALTTNQSRLITRYTKDVVLSYDADSAGRNAALRGSEILKNAGCKVRVMHVTDGKDPDDFIKKEGKKAFLDLVEKALPYADYRIASVMDGYDMSDSQQKIECLKRIAEVLRSLGPVEQDIYIKKVSREIDISEMALRAEIGQNKSDDSVRTKSESRETSHNELTTVEKDLLRLVIRNGDFANRIMEAGDIVTSETGKKILKAMADDISSNVELDPTRIMDLLSDEEILIFDEISENIPFEGDEEKVFNDCISRARIENLRKEEKRLFMMIDIAENSSIDREEQNRLMKKLMEIQKQIATERAKGQ